MNYRITLRHRTEAPIVAHLYPNETDESFVGSLSTPKLSSQREQVAMAELLTLIDLLRRFDVQVG